MTKGKRIRGTDTEANFSFRTSETHLAVYLAVVDILTSGFRRHKLSTVHEQVGLSGIKEAAIPSYRSSVKSLFA